MKNKSPTHKTIQLRRKTQKIAIPKATWDLSNKQNTRQNNITHNNYSNLNSQQSKSKNSSLKKYSLDKKKQHLKKSSSITQQIFGHHGKNIGNNFKKGQDISSAYHSNVSSVNKKADKQIQKNRRGFPDKLKQLYYKSKNGTNISHQTLKTQYDKIFRKINPATAKQKALTIAMQQHIFLWLDKYEQMRDLVQTMAKDTSKYNQGTDHFSQETIQPNATASNMSNISESQLSLSYCEYIVDPKEEVCYRSLKAEQLKEQLHLNLSKVSEMRRKQFMP